MYTPVQEISYKLQNPQVIVKLIISYALFINESFFKLHTTEKLKNRNKLLQYFYNI